MSQPAPPPESGVTHSSATRIARSTIMVIGILAFAKAFSLVEQKIALSRFGVGASWDTYATAAQLPEQLFNLIAGGALAYAFIPVFGGFLTRDDRDGAWKLASNVLNTVFMTACLVSIFVFLFAPWLVAHLLAPGYVYADLSLPLSESAMFTLNRVVQTAVMLRILLLGLLIFSISGLSGGILWTHQHFLLPSIAPILYDAGKMLGVLVFAHFFGIYGVAIGAVIGAAMHLGIQVPGLIHYKARWRPILNWHNPELQQVIKLMIPRAVGLGLLNLNLLVAYNIASGLSAGSGAAFNRGWGLMQLPETLIGTAMGIVIFPTLATLSAAGDLSGKRTAMSGALRFILIASIPAAVAMVLAGRPLLGILEGGAFTGEGADRVFRVVQFFALGVITHSSVEVVARSFYADKDTMTPLLVAIVTATANLIMALTLVNVFSVAGLALANSLSVGLELLILMAILRRRWQGIDEAALLITTGKALVAAVAMGAAMIAAETVLGRVFGSGGMVSLLLHAGIQIGIGGAVYVVVALLLRMEEVRALPQIVMRRRAAVSAVASTGD